MDPVAGTFLSIDPIVPSNSDPQSLNAYAYGRNNPVNLTDPTGTCTIYGSSCSEARVYYFQTPAWAVQAQAAIKGVDSLMNEAMGHIISNTAAWARAQVKSEGGGGDGGAGSSGSGNGGAGSSGSAPSSSPGRSANAGNAAPVRSDFDRAVSRAASNASSKTAQLEADTGSYVMQGRPSWWEWLSNTTEGETQIGDYRVTRANGEMAGGGNIGSRWNASSAEPRNVRALVVAPYGASPGYLQSKIDARADFYATIAAHLQAPVIVIGPLGATTTFASD